jgi:hypothetical protein
MNERARFIASQPRFISINLYRGVDGRQVIIHIEPKFREKWNLVGQLTDNLDPHPYNMVPALK